MQLFHDVTSMRREVGKAREARKTIGFVPTMGALHKGHLTLVEQAKTETDVVIVSIFVNPKQFGPQEDLSRYPRKTEEDLALLREAGVSGVFMPTEALMYPSGFATSMRVGKLSEGLCGAVRPGHFDGVALVVTKLFHQVMPHKAFFGEKDFQQLMVIKQLVTDLDMPIAIRPVPIVREVDGLALSSRNAYLTPEERLVAPELFKQLTLLATNLPKVPASEWQGLFETTKQLLYKAGFAQVEYLELRDQEHLGPVASLTKPARLLAAVRLGNCRLIDNVPVGGLAS